MKYLTNKELEEWRLELAHIMRIPASGILLDNRGHFSIHNIRESDSQMILNRLRQQDDISQVSRTASGYNFGHFDRYFQPEQKYTITGIINLE